MALWRPPSTSAGRAARRRRGSTTTFTAAAAAVSTSDPIGRKGHIRLDLYGPEDLAPQLAAKHRRQLTRAPLPSAATGDTFGRTPRVKWEDWDYYSDDWFLTIAANMARRRGWFPAGSGGPTVLTSDVIARKQTKPSPIHWEQWDHTAYRAAWMRRHVVLSAVAVSAGAVLVVRRRPPDWLLTVEPPPTMHQAAAKRRRGFWGPLEGPLYDCDDTPSATYDCDALGEPLLTADGERIKTSDGQTIYTADDTTWTED